MTGTASKVLTIDVADALEHEVTVGSLVPSDCDRFIQSAPTNRINAVGKWHRVPALGTVGAMSN